MLRLFVVIAARIDGAPGRVGPGNAVLVHDRTTGLAGRHAKPGEAEGEDSRGGAEAEPDLSNWREGRPSCDRGADERENDEALGPLLVRVDRVVADVLLDHLFDLFAGLRRVPGRAGHQRVEHQYEDPRRHLLLAPRDRQGDERDERQDERQPQGNVDDSGMQRDLVHGRVLAEW